VGGKIEDRDLDARLLAFPEPGHGPAGGAADPAPVSAQCGFQPSGGRLAAPLQLAACPVAQSQHLPLQARAIAPKEVFQTSPVRLSTAVLEAVYSGTDRGRLLPRPLIKSRTGASNER
jgi:hypothetical protein